MTTLKELKNLCEKLDALRFHMSSDEEFFELAEEKEGELLDEEDRERLGDIGTTVSEFWNVLAGMCDKYYDRLNKAREED